MEIKSTVLYSGFLFLSVLWYNVSMRLSHKIDGILAAIVSIAVVLVLACFFKNNSIATYAEGENETYVDATAHFVTFYDEDTKLTVKTEAQTVSEALERAGFIINQGDLVEPKMDTVINADNFFINIYRARPVVIKDGNIEKYIMTASYDMRTIVGEAGISLYDGDEVELMPDVFSLETGTVNVYQITRNGGRTLTIEEEIPFAEEEVKDVNLDKGTSEVRQLGEVGAKRSYYNVLYVDGVEVSRELVSEEVVREPVSRIVAVGAKKSIPPEWETCAGWARAAGVSEADLSAALDLIYHESGCRVDAENVSSGAYGIPQALPGNKMASAGADWQTNPVTQIRWMSGYVSRYGGWQGAINWWYSHGWY